MALYELNKRDETIEIRIFAHKVLDDPVIIVDEYASLHIIVEQGACVTIVDCSYGSDQQVKMSISSQATLYYYMDGTIAQEKRYMRTVHSSIDYGACLAVFSSVRCAGFFSFHCTALLDGINACFFSGATVVVLPNGTYTQRFVQKHTHQQTFSESKLYGIIEEMGTLENNGLIVVEENAPRSVAEHSTKCLTAGKYAKINAKPMLEIAPKEVFVKHGAAIGPVDQELVLFLQSRGIEPNQATMLLKRAFLAQIHMNLPAWISQKTRKRVVLPL